MDTRLLERAAPLFRCPACDGGPLRPGGAGLACAACRHAVPSRDGWLDFLGGPPSAPTAGQRVFLSAASARAYAAARENPLVFLTNGKTFQEEVRFLVDALGAAPDARLLDVPCGQANFTQAIARAVPEGLVIGLDLSEAMLRLARDRLRRERLTNVLLVRGTALDLPLTDGAVDAVSNPGGLHLYPDPPRAIAEMRRVVRDGGRVAGLTVRAFDTPIVDQLAQLIEQMADVHAFDFDRLGDDFRRVGFSDWRWEGRGLVSYFSARA